MTDSPRFLHGRARAGLLLDWTRPGVVLTHDDVVGDYATLWAGVTPGGRVTVGEAVYLGMGALVRERLTVGAESILGMGAVLLHDLPRGEVWEVYRLAASVRQPSSRSGIGEEESM